MVMFYYPTTMVKDSIIDATTSTVPATGFGFNQQRHLLPLPPQQYQQQPPIITTPSELNPFFHPQLR